MSSDYQVAPEYKPVHDANMAKVKKNKKIYDEKVKEMYRVVEEYESWLEKILKLSHRIKRPLTKKLPKLVYYRNYFLDSIDFLNFDKANENFTSRTPKAQLNETKGLVAVTDQMAKLLPDLEALIKNPQYAHIGGIWDSISSAYAGAKKKASEFVDAGKEIINNARTTLADATP
ncbi:MAG: hypothetical protein QMC37_01830 [Flavobacteriales bacterium]